MKIATPAKILTTVSVLALLGGMPAVAQGPIVPTAPATSATTPAPATPATAPGLGAPVASTMAPAAVPGTAVPTQLDIHSQSTAVPAGAATPAAATAAGAPVAGTAAPSAASKAAATTPTDIGSDPAITSVMDRLKTDTAPLSLGDMAAAQDTLARLNLLGEIETKLSQIETARNTRTGAAAMGGMGIGTGGMPAAGGMPNLPLPATMPPLSAQGMPDMSQFATSSATVQHISGTNGHYNAVIKTDGRQMIVRQGTVLPSGAQVTEVNANGVKIKNKGGHTETLSFADSSATLGE